MMKVRTRSERRIDGKPSSGRHAGLAWLCLVLVLYGIAHVLARTAGARSLLEERMEVVLGQPVSVEAMRLSWCLSIVLKGMQGGGGAEPGEPGLAVGEVRLRWSPFGFFAKRAWVVAAEAHGATIHLIRDAQGGWQPEIPAAVAGFTASRLGMGNGTELSADTFALPSRFQLTGGAFRWWDAGGRETAYLSGVEAVVTDLFPPGQTLRYERITALRGRCGRRGEASDLLLEQVASAEARAILVQHLHWKAGSRSEVGGQGTED